MIHFQRTLTLSRLTLPALLLIGASAGIWGYTPAAAFPLSAITVNTPDDELNQDGDCSLREAIQAANLDAAVDACPAGGGDDTVNLPEGTYLLTLPGGEEDANQTGDLDILGNTTVNGAGNEKTIVDGGGLDRVFHILGLSAVKIKNVTITNGLLSGAENIPGGGGIRNVIGDLELVNVVLVNNHVNTTGGGLDNTGTAILVDITFTQNTGKNGGGLFNGGTIIIDNSLFYTNTATATGGALENNNTATLTNLTFSDNHAFQGGGIFNDYFLYISNSTFYSNTIGIYNSFGTVYTWNTILANKGAINCITTEPIISQGNNLESGETCAFNNTGDQVNTPPLIAPLQDNDGPTWTHALLEGSAAIDAGNNSGCPITDQRGASRPADGDNDEIAICDIGAFELGGEFSQPLAIYLPIIKRN